MIIPETYAGSFYIVEYEGNPTIIKIRESPDEEYFYAFGKECASGHISEITKWIENIPVYFIAARYDLHHK